MGVGIFLGITGVLTAIFIGIKVLIKVSENKVVKKEQEKQRLELEADAKKYAKETDLFNKKISCPYEDKTTRSYEPRNQKKKKNKNKDLER